MNIETGSSVSTDAICWVKITAVTLPLKKSVSDAKVLTGRQKPLNDVALLFAEIETKYGYRGLGFTYTLRTGGPAQFEHAKELAPLLIGEDPNDIAKIWTKLVITSYSIHYTKLYDFERCELRR